MCAVQNRTTNRNAKIKNARGNCNFELTPRGAVLSYGGVRGDRHGFPRIGSATLFGVVVRKL
jgi:hypothetical protein